MILLENLSLLDLAAKSTLNDENTKNIYKSIDYALHKRYETYIKKFYLNLDNLTDSELDYLLWENSLDYLDENLDRKNKIELLHNALLLHFNKGTVGAVKAICNILFGNADVLEWFEYGGLAGHFKIYTEYSQITENSYDKVLRTVNEYKNVRSLLEAIIFIRSSIFKLNAKIYSECKKVNFISMRDFNLPYLNEKLNVSILGLTKKQNYIGIRK
ncbi:phage tail protein I [Streptobacillus ratti]|uniref:phage tail protein I n=1 Tax=Streptobacillus ratti TaxID=1720557 RepID=UPI0009328C7F|nr:phage tail protein I [Streptobacillus ratti]